MTHDPARWLWAVAAIVAWLIVVGAVIASVRAARRREAAKAAALAGDGGDVTLVAYASQTGLAEELAWMSARLLSDAGWGVRVVSFADLTEAMLKDVGRALFVVSTTGEGDAPDSAGRFLRRTLAAEAELGGLTYGLLSLGDHEYKDFCGFGRAVDGWLRRSGAAPLFDAIEVDDADPEAIRQWQHQLNGLTGSTAQPDWTPPAYDRWRLIERTHVNPGGPGGEAFHLALEPIDHAPDWSAGDIAEIGVPTAEDQAPAAREYSIASLPGDGRLELLVRLMRHPDGRPGLASGWLTGQATIGDEVAMRVRTNRNFHGPEAATPMILIGNGTGIAGLRAHIRARPGARTWLLFGERTSVHDAFFDAELQAALADGGLTRLDRAFSRDPGDGRYVQALVADQAGEIRTWIDQGAAIYVCGSLDGMAPGVDAALTEVLGAETMIALAEAGRYRRDVY